MLHVLIADQQKMEARAMSFQLVRTMTQWQSVYPDIALHISDYCVYCTEDQNLTQTI